MRGTGHAVESKVDAAFAFLQLVFQRGGASTQVREGVVWGGVCAVNNLGEKVGDSGVGWGWSLKR